MHIPDPNNPHRPPARIQWLWPGHLPCGKITLISGEPGVGKSRLATDFAARISGGHPWPDGQPPCEPGDVILCCAEDDSTDTIFPRLRAGGCDFNRVAVVEPFVRETGEVTATTFPRDLPQLHNILERCEAPRMIIIDPLATYIGPAGDWGTDIQSRLAPLAHLARLYSVAILAITHRDLRPRRSGFGRRALADASYLAASRVAWHISMDEQDPNPDDSLRRRWFTPLKNNIGSLPPARAFHFADEALSWDDPPPVPPPPPVPSESDLAAEFLRNLLADGPVPAAEVYEQAQENLFCRNTIRRVGQQLGVRSRSTERQGQWKWSLPTFSNEPQVKDTAPTLENSLKNEPAGALTWGSR